MIIEETNFDKFEFLIIQKYFQLFNLYTDFIFKIYIFEVNKRATLILFHKSNLKFKFKTIFLNIPKNKVIINEQLKFSIKY